MEVKDVEIIVNWKGFIEDKKKNEFMLSICFLCKEFIIDKKCLDDIINFKVKCGNNITIVVPVADVIAFLEKEEN